MGGHLSVQERWFYGNVQINVSNSYKYLGMVFSTKLSFSYAWDEASRKAKKGVIEILKTLRKLKCIDCSVFWKLFDAQIEPILTYAAEIWGLYNNTRMEKVHTYAMKRFLNVPIHSSNTLLYGETGRYPLYIKVYVKCVKYWLKLLNRPQSRLCKQAYDMALLQMEMGKINWVYKIKKLLVENGFGIVWIFQGVGNEQKFVAEFKDRMICTFKQNWHSNMESKEKYNWFFAFKNVFGMEKYLSVITDKWHRINFARFRFRTLGFNAHKFWFQSDTSIQTPCSLCGSQIDDENHFLFECNVFDKIREKCSVFQLDVVRSKDISALLSSDNESVIQSVAKFIAEAQTKRQNHIQNHIN